MSPIILKVHAPDRALTAAFQAAGAALAATYLPCPGPGDAPEYRAAIREAVGFAIKGGPHRHRAQARPVLLPGRPRGAGAGIPHLKLFKPFGVLTVLWGTSQVESNSIETSGNAFEDTC